MVLKRVGILSGEGTDCTFGYQTVVQVACDALDRLHTTGESHQRVMIL
jgi:ATP-dependent phosphofructokinase / diphosphate-dependent phosphofructokinase